MLPLAGPFAGIVVPLRLPLAPELPLVGRSNGGRCSFARESGGPCEPDCSGKVRAAITGLCICDSTDGCVFVSGGGDSGGAGIGCVASGGGAVGEPPFNGGGCRGAVGVGAIEGEFVVGNGGGAMARPAPLTARGLNRKAPTAGVARGSPARAARDEPSFARRGGAASRGWAACEAPFAARCCGANFVLVLKNPRRCSLRSDLRITLSSCITFGQMWACAPERMERPMTSASS